MSLNCNRCVFRGIFRRIVEQIEQDLLEQNGIKLNHRQISWNGNIDLMMNQNLGCTIERCSDKITNVVKRQIGLHRSRFNPRHIEEVSDEAVQAL